ncbi:hypothetical protein RhiirA4_460163 [Rhizophagus irregularis]|uniref:F-box domain-containing protein n=1 Tax=Rhizophagus irregularis TaxID=588596 RepID=A0A2I1GG09_9GLOM|nr:hypothetical protein RhiirA4_460163 [Rhizophagus irregularis]
MIQLDEDILLLVLGELKNDKKSLYSCLLVSRTWCVITGPILWRNPKSRDILKNQGINNFITETYLPLFNYISFWKCLELQFLEDIISSKRIEKSNVPIIRNEILKLFINKNTKFIHISIPPNFDYQLHLIPGAESCLSELESFQCDVNITQNILEGLAKICKSIKKLRFDSIHYYYTDNFGIIKLVEVQKNLNYFCLLSISSFRNESFYKSIEESLIKHADTIRYLIIGWSPTTRFLSHFVNLLSLEIEMPDLIKGNPYWNDEKYLKNLSLPSTLKILEVRFTPLNVLVNIIENTTENISEISIHCNDDINYDGCKILIQAIYHNCPNIRYLKLTLYRNLLIPEFKNLLINCQFLNGLIINVCKDHEFNWNKLFQVLTILSPINLFKFKFYSNSFKLEDLKLFFDNWKNRKAILLKLINAGIETDQELVSLFEQYKAKGIIENCFFGNSNCCAIDEDFEWI